MKKGIIDSVGYRNAKKNPTIATTKTIFTNSMVRRGRGRYI